MVIQSIHNDEDNTEKLKVLPESELKLFFKVWQDAKSIGKGYTHCIMTKEEALQEIQNIIDSGEYEEDDFPVFQPVLMTQKQVDLLPDFGGF